MKEEKKKKSIFAWALLPAVLSLAWPTMLEQLMQTAVQYIDTAMVGSLGTAATAAVGSTLTGGCAKNDGLKEAIEHVLKLKVVNLKTDPQLMGALGAAEYARQKGLAKK